MIPTKVNRGLKSGVIGTFAFSGPRRIQTAILDSATETNNVFGRVYTYKDGDNSEQVVQAGGAGAIAGLMVEPLSATVIAAGIAANGSTAQLCSMGEIYATALELEGKKIGEPVKYNPATGELTMGEGAEIPNCFLARHEPSAETPNLCVIRITF